MGRGMEGGGGGRLGIGLCTCLTLPLSLIPPTPFSNFLYLSPNTTLVLLSSPRNENGIWHFNLQVLVTECLDCQFDFFQCHQTINCLKYPLHCGTEVHGCLHNSRSSSGHNLCGSISSGPHVSQ